VLSAGNRKALPTTGIPVGLIAGRATKSALLVLNPGDSLVLFTDGVTEAMNSSEQEFGTARLEALLDAAGATPAAELLARIYADVDAFAAGADQADDITCLTLRLAPSRTLAALNA
jgi:serine phosphatase RsbU (regulator of sigma subunit)